MHYLVFRSDLCTGCKICSLACSFEKFGSFSLERSCIRVEVEHDGLKAEARYCQQCRVPACVHACPADAIVKTDERLHIDVSRCTKCGLCLRVCYYGGLFKDPRSGYPLMCDTCGECARKCPTGALVVLETPEGGISA